MQNPPAYLCWFDAICSFSLYSILLTNAQSSFLSLIQQRWHLSNEGVQQECQCRSNYCVHIHVFHLSLFWLCCLSRSHLITHYIWIKYTDNMEPNSVPLCIGAEGLKSHIPTVQESGRPWRNHKEVHCLCQKSVLRWYIVQYPWGLGGVTCTVGLCAHGSTGQKAQGVGDCESNGVYCPFKTVKRRFQA